MATAFELLAALGSLAEIISLVNTSASSLYMARETGQPIAAVHPSKIVDAARRMGQAQAEAFAPAIVILVPGPAIDALADKANELELAAAADIKAAGLDPHKLRQIASDLRHNFCQILKAIMELNSGELPSPLDRKWDQFRCS
ncbi:hypothetical protein [Rubellimicrobium aerolatum]|uniref:Uncharacterized protein n=1 Tax=Rubellimicrobium aerolatum TaxID=490979 RepID=A0ABW0SAT3_9RHOB|nr:hypothetical protein [Rubellimicrobium aerolatum]MBP1805340.1 hypothetical protein [Rubellimicrobium aerolatum]